MKGMIKRAIALLLALLVIVTSCPYEAMAGEKGSLQQLQGKLAYTQALLQEFEGDIQTWMQPYIDGAHAVADDPQASDEEARTQMETLDMVIETLNTYEESQDQTTQAKSGGLSKAEGSEGFSQNLSEAELKGQESQTDPSALNEAIAQAAGIAKGNYTDKSYDALKKIVTAAELAVNDAALNQETADIYTSAVWASIAALTEKTVEGKILDGIYTIPSVLKHANNRQDSMGNAALKKPSHLTVIDGKGTLTLDFVSLSIALGTGYLGQFYYLTYDQEGYPPAGTEVFSPTVTAYYEGVYDTYNNPVNGIDALMKGKLYPKSMTMPVTLGDSEIWVQVYVPIMEGISAGAGKQFARLQLNYGNMEQVSGLDSDKSILNAMINRAKNVAQGTASDEVYAALQASIAASAELAANMNASQDQVNAQTDALQCAAEIITGKILITDKSALEAKLAEANAYLSKTKEYTAASLASLKKIIETADTVFGKEDASQAEIDGQVTILEQGVAALVKLADKTALTAKIKEAQGYLEQTGVYTEESLNVLKSAVEGAKKISDNAQAVQSDADEVVKSLNSAIANLEKKKTADKSKLKEKLEEAEKLAEQSDTYTSSTLKALKTVMKAAQAVYDANDAPQTSIDAQTEALTAAIRGLKKTTDETLDYKNLKDGVYSVYTDMIKTDRVSKSMSNDAINHTIKLTVKDGTYNLTLDFTGLKINGSFGYLSKLKYYADGYTYDSLGNPQGTLKDVTVLTTQKDSDGNVVVDIYNDAQSPYPDTVSFELVKTALNDENGLVPLQVFVPIMDAISAGAGTQNVLMKLDWTTLKSTTDDDPDLQPDDPAEQSPAFDKTVNGVRIAAEKGMIPEGAKAEVTEIAQGEEYTSAKTALSSVFSNFKLYKITLSMDGNEIQPEGFITISIPLGSLSGTKAGVYRVNSDGTKSLLAGSVEDGMYVFKTNKTGLFAIGEKTASSITPNTNKPTVNIPKTSAGTTPSTGGTAVKTAANAKTGDTTPIVLFGMLFMASLGILSLAVSRRLKTRNR